LKVYPFDFEFIISYRLSDNNLFIDYVVNNKGNKEMYFSIGAHPGFNCPIEISTDTKNDQYYIEFETEENAETYLVENGYISENKVSFLKNEKIIKLSKDLFSNDAIIFENLNSKKVTIKGEATNRFISVDFDGFKYLGIWSKSEGAPFVCIEPWNGIGDSQNSSGVLKNKKDILSLLPGNEFVCGYSIKIG
jgi:galactose mutarotase-like enzyme